MLQTNDRRDGADGDGIHTKTTAKRWIAQVVNSLLIGIVGMPCRLAPDSKRSEEEEKADQQPNGETLNVVYTFTYVCLEMMSNRAHATDVALSMRLLVSLV